MAITMSHGSALDAAPPRWSRAMPARPSVPSTRPVMSLEAALGEIRLSGGRVTSETRTAPGIGSWAFVADADGVELVLWEDASAGPDAGPTAQARIPVTGRQESGGRSGADRLDDAMTTATRSDPLAPFSEPTRTWFREAFADPTRAQELGWQAISSGSHALIHAPTGSGKTLAAFLWCLDRLMTEPAPAKRTTVRVLYVSPLKALDLRRRAQPARPAGGDPAHGRTARAAGAGDHGRQPHGRHAGRRAAAAREDAAGHPGHHARVALPAPHQPGARDPARRRARDRGRGACHRGHQARLAPGPQPRAAEPPRRAPIRSASACRPRSGRWRHRRASSAAPAARWRSWTRGRARSSTSR